MYKKLKKKPIWINIDILYWSFSLICVGYKNYSNIPLEKYSNYWHIIYLFMRKYVIIKYYWIKNEWIEYYYKSKCKRVGAYLFIKINRENTNIVNMLYTSYKHKWKLYVKPWILYRSEWMLINLQYVIHIFRA